MTDIMTKIVRKKIALYAQLKEIKRESYRQIVEIEQEIAAIDKAVETLNAVVNDCVCPICAGTGMERYMDADRNMDERTCMSCKGTGVKGGGSGGAQG